MKTYFVAGYSRFYGGTPDRPFWRVMNIDDKVIAHELLEEVVSDARNHPRNFIYRDGSIHPFTEVGDVIITAFNQV